MLTKKHIIKYKSKLLRKSWLLLLGFIFLFGVANAGSIDVHKVKGNTENKALPVEYALLGTDYAVTDFVTYANSASEVPPVIRKYSSYFGIVYTMGRIGGSLYSSAKLATAEEAAFAESAAKASTSEITTEETATATTVTSTEEKVTATSTEETAPTTPAKETTASEGTTTGTTTKENVPVETKTTVINDGSVAKARSKIATSGDELITLCKNVSKGSDEMLQAAKTRIAQYRADMKGIKKLGGNLWYVEGEMNGIKLDDGLVSSVTEDLNAPKIFDAQYVNSANEIKPSKIDGAWLRTGDSEFQMVTEKIAKKFNLEKGIIYTEYTGTVKIVSELPYCGSCSGVIHQLSDKLPNVKFIIVNGAK